MCVRQTSRVSDPRTGNCQYQLEPEVIILDINVLVSISPFLLTSLETIMKNKRLVVMCVRPPVSVTLGQVTVNISWPPERVSCGERSPHSRHEPQRV